MEEDELDYASQIYASLISDNESDSTAIMTPNGFFMTYVAPCSHTNTDAQIKNTAELGEVGDDECTQRQKILAYIMSRVNIWSSLPIEVCDIYPLGVLTDLGSVEAWRYGMEEITRFILPNIGTDNLTYRNIRYAKNTIESEKEYLGGNVNHYVYAARTALVGEQVIIFKILTVTGNEYTFLLTNTSIVKIDNMYNVNIYIEQDMKLYNMSSEFDHEHILTIPVVIHRYQQLDIELLEEVNVNDQTEGILLNIDGHEYNCQKKKIVTLKKNKR